MRQPQRGPDPDDPEGQLSEIVERVERIAAEAAARATVNIRDYREGTSANTWIAISGLAITVLGAIVTMSMQFSALRQEVTDLQGQVEHMERLLEPHFRGSP